MHMPCLQRMAVACMWPQGHKRRDVPQDITDWLQAGPNAGMPGRLSWIPEQVKTSSGTQRSHPSFPCKNDWNNGMRSKPSGQWSLPWTFHVFSLEALRLRFPDAQGLALGLVRAAPKAPRRLCLEVPRHLLSNRVGDMIHSCNSHFWGVDCDMIFRFCKS